MDFLTYKWTNKLFYTTYICVDLAHDDIVRAKVGKGGITYIMTKHYLMPTHKIYI